MDCEHIEDAGYNDFVLCPKCQDSVGFPVIDEHGMCKNCRIKYLEAVNVELLAACKDFAFLEKTNMTKKQVQLRIDIAKVAIEAAKGE